MKKLKKIDNQSYHSIVNSEMSTECKECTICLMDYEDNDSCV